MKDYNRQIWDLLIIGKGLAGGIAALQAANEGAKVLMVDSQVEPASRWAQGGIVCPKTDDAATLKIDILMAGAGQSFEEAVDVLVLEGPEIFQKWFAKNLHVNFDPDLALEAAHSKARIAHVRDATGMALMDAVQEKVNFHVNINCISGVLVDLLQSHIHDERPGKQFSKASVVGAYIYDLQEKQVHAICSKSTILATGGFSQLFEHSTGPSGSMGAGISAAHRTGARTTNLEYVQFHPTSLYIEGERRYLLTEALRGAGAKIYNLKRQSFLDELAPRDVVARQIHEEMQREGGAHVWLDISKILEIENRFPAICHLLNEKGFDPKRDLIPIVPAAHYTMGGIWTDLQGATNVPGLFAAGEVACTGIHGANRLASTSLLEALVFGERSARSACEYYKRENFDFQPRKWLAVSDPVDPALLNQDWNLLRSTLWNYVGLVRTERRMLRAEKLLLELRSEVENFYKRSVLSPDLIGLRHGVLVATLFLYSALRNRESIGSHFLRGE